MALKAIFNTRKNTHFHHLYAYEKFQRTVSHNIFKTLIRMFFYSAETKERDSKINEQKYVHSWVVKEPSITGIKIIKRKKCEKSMTVKFLDAEKHFHTEFLKLKKGRA